MFKGTPDSSFKKGPGTGGARSGGAGGPGGARRGGQGGPPSGPPQ
jgi:hypothetical protein